MPDPPDPKRYLHWDGTITAGNTLTAAAMLVAMLGVWFRLENRVDYHTDRIQRLETARERDDRDTAVQREALATMKANQEAQLTSLGRLERQLDRLLADLQGRR